MQRRHLLIMPAVLLAGRPALAVEPAAAGGFVKTVLTTVMGIVNGNGPDKAARLQAVLDANVDIAGIARFCVGRFWRTATPAQQAEYQGLFHKVLANNVLGRIGDYQGTSFEMGAATAREEGVAVATTLSRPNNAPNKVEWIVAEVEGPLKVIDVVAEGTSLRLTQRSDYLSFIGRNGNALQPLIDALKQQAAR